MPTLDVRALRGGDAPKFVRELHASLREFGFVCFVGHGVDEAVTGAEFYVMERISGVISHKSGFPLPW